MGHSHKTGDLVAFEHGRETFNFHAGWAAGQVVNVTDDVLTVLTVNKHGNPAQHRVPAVRVTPLHAQDDLVLEAWNRKNELDARMDAARRANAAITDSVTNTVARFGHVSPEDIEQLRPSRRRAKVDDRVIAQSVTIGLLMGQV